MIVECADFSALADAWTSSSLDERTLRLMASHLADCSACRRRHPGFLALLARDAGLEPSSGTDDAEAERSEAIILSRAERLGPPRPLPSPQARRRMAFMALAPAAAIAALLAALILPLRGGLDTVTARFSLEAPDAHSVHLTGDFVSWDGQPLALEWIEGRGRWEIGIPLKKGRSYRYNFIIDGHTWVVDPHADVNVDDGFGSSSSLLRR